MVNKFALNLMIKSDVRWLPSMMMFFQTNVRPRVRFNIVKIVGFMLFASKRVPGFVLFSLKKFYISEINSGCKNGHSIT